MRTWEQRGLRQYSHAPGVEYWRTVTKEGEPGNDRLTATAFGRRSDGQHFSVEIQIGLEEYADDARRTAVLKEKFDVLDTFLDPRCECDFPQVCGWHQLGQYKQVLERPAREEE